MALVALAALSMVLAAVLVAPSRADAHQTAGRTLIYVDGELVKNTKDDHFTYARRLSPGCHTVEVVQKRGGEVVYETTKRVCVGDPARLTVRADHSSVTTTITASDGGSA